MSYQALHPLRPGASKNFFSIFEERTKYETTPTSNINGLFTVNGSVGRIGSDWRFPWARFKNEFNVLRTKFDRFNGQNK